MSSTLLNLLNPSQGTKSTLFDLTTLPGVILATGGFILLWSLLKRYVDRRGPIEAIYHIILSHGGLYSLFALAMSVEIVREGSLGPELDDEWLRWIYHFSKFYEYINMLLLVAQGKIVDPYTAFYHLAVRCTLLLLLFPSWPSIHYLLIVGEISLRPQIHNFPSRIPCIPCSSCSFRSFPIESSFGSNKPTLPTDAVLHLLSRP